LISLIPTTWPIALRSAVTDADLFLSYNLPDKAIVPLLGALPHAPRDARLNQRLVALHTRFQRFTEAAVCCRTLESVYHDAGYPDEAVRYGELAARYEQTAEAAPCSSPHRRLLHRGSFHTLSLRRLSIHLRLCPRPGRWPRPRRLTMKLPRPSIRNSPSRNTSGTRLRTGTILLPTSPPSGAFAFCRRARCGRGTLGHRRKRIRYGCRCLQHPEIAETVEEVRFYLDHFMTDQARAGIEKLETLTSDARILDPLRAAIESSAQPPAEPESEITEINADEINADEINADEPADFEVEMETQHGSRSPPRPV